MNVQSLVDQVAALAAKDQVLARVTTAIAQLQSNVAALATVQVMGGRCMVGDFAAQARAPGRPGGDGDGAMPPHPLPPLTMPTLRHAGSHWRPATTCRPSC
jgi:hypothetical protein